MTTVTITFACHNQAHYTMAFLSSLMQAGDDLSRVVAVDNHSSDTTLSVLDQFKLGCVIRNKTNLGCGVAWNQGTLAFQSDWTVVMNNDVLVSPGWLEGLINAAQEQQLQIASPAMIEGPDDYNFSESVESFYSKTRNLSRLTFKHAVCMAIHRSVFEKIGYFMPQPKLLGYEDTLFFAAADRAGIRSAIVGGSWIHHFGSVTQTAMKLERGLSSRDPLGAPNNSRLLNENWFYRKSKKWFKRRLQRQLRDAEYAESGMSLHGIREQGIFRWT
jgi:GT2 family glycosyltransferase